MASPPCPVQPPKNVPNLNLLHPSLVELMRRCFIDGHRNPSLRPSPAVWEKTIASAEEALVSCSEGHWYSDHLRTCPYCSTDQNSPPTQRYAPHPAKPISTLKRQQSAQSAQPIAAVMQPTTSPTGGRSPFSRLSMSGLAASSVHTPSTPSTPRSVYSPVKPFLWASRPALSQWPVWKQG